MALLDFMNRGNAPQQASASQTQQQESPAQRSVQSLPDNVKAEAVEAARKFLQDNGVKVDQASIQSLTADIFDETGLAGPRDAFRDAFTELARQS